MSVITSSDPEKLNDGYRIAFLERQVGDLKADMKIVQELIKQNNAVLQELIDAVQKEQSK